MMPAATLAPSGLALSKAPPVARLGRPGLGSACDRPLVAPLSRARRAAHVVTALQDDESDKGFKTSPLLPAFTRRREHTMGRVAALGFAAALVGELLAGVGPATQLSYELGVTHRTVYLAAIALGVWGFVGGLLSGSPTYDPANRRDLAKRVPINPFKEPRRFLARNEVLVGRLAMAGFAGACVLEFLWNGESPLVHLGLIQPGTQLSEAPWWIIGIVALFAANGLGLFSAIGKNDDQAF